MNDKSFAQSMRGAFADSHRKDGPTEILSEQSHEHCF